MLRNGEIRPFARLCHHQMASDLTDDLPSSALEGFGRFLAGNIRELSHVCRFVVRNLVLNCRP
jgi:hypothetical protein